MARPAKIAPPRDGSGGPGTTALVNMRVPADEVQEWRAVMQAARDIGLERAQRRLAADPGVWGDLLAQATATWEHLRAIWPEGRGAPPPSPETLMQALLDEADELLALEAEIRQKRDRLRHLEAEVAERERVALGDASERLQQIETAIAREQERWGLTREGTHMVAALAEAGWSTEEVLAWGRALQAAQAQPGQLVALWEQLGGIEAQIAVLQPAVVKLQQARQVLEQQLAHTQQLIAAEQDRLASTRRERDRLRAEAQTWAERVAAMQEEASRWRRTAEAFGLWLPPLGEAWPRQPDDPARAVALVLAASCLAEIVRTWGDMDLELPARFEPNRPFRLANTVGLGELATLLAPPAVVQDLAQQMQSAPAAERPNGAAQVDPVGPSEEVASA